MAFNISDNTLAFDKNAKAWCRIQHPLDIETFFEVETESKQNPAHKQRLAVLGKKLRRDQESAKRRKQEVDALQYEPEIVKMSALLCTDWRHIVDGEKEIPFNRDQLEKMMIDQPWIYDQIDLFQADDDNFFKSGG